MVFATLTKNISKNARRVAAKSGVAAFFWPKNGQNSILNAEFGSIYQALQSSVATPNFLGCENICCLSLKKNWVAKLDCQRLHLTLQSIFSQKYDVLRG